MKVEDAFVPVESVTGELPELVAPLAGTCRDRGIPIYTAEKMNLQKSVPSFSD